MRNSRGLKIQNEPQKTEKYFFARQTKKVCPIKSLYYFLSNLSCIFYTQGLNFISSLTMNSTFTKFCNNDSTYGIKQYLPPMPVLQEAPDSASIFNLTFNIQMPKLTKATKTGRITKKRNTEHFPKKASGNVALILDDSPIPTRKYHRRTKEEIQKARYEKEAIEMELLSCASKVSAVTKRPYMKTVKLNVNEILNMAFESAKSGVLYKCISSWCKYRCKSEKNFLSHLCSHHKNDSSIVSNSFCRMCNTKINAETLEAEFYHMMTVHLADGKYSNFDNNDKSTIVKDQYNVKNYLNSYQRIFEASVKVHKQECEDRYPEIEKHLMEMFDDGSGKVIEGSMKQSNQKVNVIHVECLPNIGVFEIYQEKANKYDQNGVENFVQDDNLDPYGAINYNFHENIQKSHFKRRRFSENSEFFHNFFENLGKSPVLNLEETTAYENDSILNMAENSSEEISIDLSKCHFGVLEPKTDDLSQKNHEYLHNLEESNDTKVVDLIAVQETIKNFDVNLPEADLETVKIKSTDQISNDSPSKKNENDFFKDCFDQDEGYNDEIRSESDENNFDVNKIPMTKSEIKNRIENILAELSCESNEPFFTTETVSKISAKKSARKLKNPRVETKKPKVSNRKESKKNAVSKKSKPKFNKTVKKKSDSSKISDAKNVPEMTRFVDDDDVMLKKKSDPDIKKKNKIKLSAKTAHESKKQSKSENQTLKHSLSHPPSNKVSSLGRDLQRSFSDEPKKKCAKKFKPSLSVAQNFKNLEEPLKVPKQSTKMTTSNFIDKLLSDEKSVNQIKQNTPPQSRRSSLINFEASTSKDFKTNFKPSPEPFEDDLTLASAEVLMPWLAENVLRKNQKYEVCYSKMLSKPSIGYLYKCMSLKCSYATNDAEIFLNHLLQHEKSQNFSEEFLCSYCLYKEKSPKNLAHHIYDVHSKDIYQCSLCLYRSREKETCNQHYKITHKSERAKIYKCAKEEMGNKATSLMIERLKRKRALFVAPIRCQCE